MQKNCLFVCTGNTCRSPMAHAMAQQLAYQQGLAIAIDSAGIRAKAGASTTSYALAALHEQGIEWRGLSQPLSQTQLRWADQVWVMTREHLDVVKQLQQGMAVSDLVPVDLLLGDRELPDPLDCGREAYDRVLSILQQRLPELLGQ